MEPSIYGAEGTKKFDIRLKPVFPSKQISIWGDVEPDYEQPAHLFQFQNSTGFNDGVATYLEGSFQTLQFVKKLEDGTIIPGVQSEQLIIALISRHEAFQKKFPSKENACFITHLQEALHWLQHRVQDRIDRGVMGELKA